MKIRLGFVSNSSSSSFIIAVPKGTKKITDDFLQVLYGGDTSQTFPWKYAWLHSGEGPSITARYVVERILNQIKDAAPMNSEEDLSEVVTGEDPYDKMPTDNNGRINWEEYDKAFDKCAKEEAKRLISNFPNCDFYEVTFSDNDGRIDTELEHGEALRLPNVTRYSHH